MPEVKDLTTGTPAATTAICGALGSVSFGGEISNWTLKWSKDAIDVTSMSSNSYKEYIGCLEAGDGTFESKIPSISLGLTTSAVFSTSQKTFTCDIIVKDIKIVTDVAGAVVYQYAFDVNGKITEASANA